MKKRFCFVFIFILLISIFNVYKNPAFADDNKIYLGGMPAGFSLYTRGAHVVGLCDVITDDGLVSPAKNAEIQVGDIILAIDENETNNATDIDESLKNGKIKKIYINRNGNILTEKILPAKDINGSYKLGVFIRDCVNGIGTITYIQGNRFASLGHCVTDEKGDVLNIIGGNLYDCNITGQVKGQRGKAGELRGVFFNNKILAKIDKNTISGVYGYLDNKINYNELTEIQVGEPHIGNAYILSTIDGCKPKKYDISIIKSDNQNEYKNLVVKINDNELLETTGGIVQGMSGSPIVQDNKLVGAITHVFINDPTRGFGISIKNMLNK